MHDQHEDHAAPMMSDSVRQVERRRNEISDSPAGKLLGNFIAVMNEFGDDAKEAYEEALEAMRERPEEVAAEIAHAQGRTHEDDYPFRLALVHAAAELRHPSAMPLLKNLVMTPIPPERSKQPHSFSTVAEETIIRTTAVEGVEYLAADKDQNGAAVEALFEFLKQPSLSVRRAAVQALLAEGSGKKQRDRIAKLLPDDQRFLLDIERKKIEDVSQVEKPQRHLKEEAREKDSPPRFPDETENDAPRVY